MGIFMPLVFVCDAAAPRTKMLMPPARARTWVKFALSDTEHWIVSTLV